jgi:3-(3-hydroxy-phenyl)propionate hydroxylase
MVLQDEAPESLLDTYQVERRPAQRRDQLVTDATMRFMAPRTRSQRLRRSAVLALSARCRPVRRWVNSGRMSEPFTYRSSPILAADREPAREWRDALRPGGKAPDAACLIAEGSSAPRSVRLQQLLGHRFVALYFPQDDDAGKSFTREMASAWHRIPVTVWTVRCASPRSSAATPVLWDSTGELRRVFGAKPGTVFLIRPDGHVAARRRQVRAAEVAELVRLASANPREQLTGTPLSGLRRIGPPVQLRAHTGQQRTHVTGHVHE